MKREKKSLSKGRIEHGSIVLKDVLAYDLPSEPLKLIWLCCCMCHPSYTSWFTNILSSQQWVIYSQTNGTASNFPVCLICHCVFWLVIMFSDFYNLFILFAFTFVIYFIFFRIVICFALLGHPSVLCKKTNRMHTDFILVIYSS